jgi:uncharacterized protein involved in exopolysaccharide biosynthesis
MSNLSTNLPPVPPAVPPVVSQPYHGIDAADDEIDLRELFTVLWRGKLLIVGVTLLFAIGAVVVALSLPNVYRSEALLAPASEAGGGGLASKLGGLSGLAGMAGISLPGGGADKTALGLEVMQSRAFIEHFIDQHELLVPLMAATDWNEETGELLIDADAYDAVNQTWVREPDPPRQSKPSAQEAYEEFQNILAVSKDKETGFVNLSVEHFSPIVAQQWVTWLVQDVNNVMREQEVSEAERSITYLKGQVANTSLTDLQTMFFELIQGQTETIMLAKVREEYLFKTIDPAIVPEQKYGPKRALICVLGTLLGGMLAVLLVLIRHYAFKPEESV